MRLRSYRAVLRFGLLISLASVLPLTAFVGSSAAQSFPLCLTSAGVTTCTFPYTGAAETWTVPSSVTQATFDVYGAQGGGADGFSPGGSGGEATATMAVTPGDTFTIMVGGQGTGPGSGVGGFNGGGNGGSGRFSFQGGGGGGGASDVRLGGTSLANRVIVGGGGGGAANSCGTGCGTGGYGGGLTGGQGAASIPGTNGGGKGGNQTGTTGSGQLGVGSNGPSSSDQIGSGGGGGGFYGGAGGPIYLRNFYLPFHYGTGGGGGSGYGPAGVVFHPGIRSGDGLVTITFKTFTNAQLCLNGGWQQLMRSDTTTFQSQFACTQYVGFGGTLYNLAQLEVTLTASQPADGISVSTSGFGLEPGSAVITTLYKDSQQVQFQSANADANGEIDTTPFGYINAPCSEGNLYTATATGTSADSVSQPTQPGVAVTSNTVTRTSTCT